MKKFIKGILSGLLSLAMCFSMTSPILAQEEEVSDTSEQTTQEAVVDEESTEEAEETTESEEAEEQVEEQTSSMEAKNDGSITVMIHYTDDKYSDTTYNSDDYPDEAEDAEDVDGSINPDDFVEALFDNDDYSLDYNYIFEAGMYIYSAYPINHEKFYTSYIVYDANGTDIYEVEGNTAIEGDLKAYNTEYDIPESVITTLTNDNISVKESSFTITKSTRFNGYIYEDNKAYGIYSIALNEKPDTMTIVYRTFNTDEDDDSKYKELSTVTVAYSDDIEEAIREHMTFDGSEEYVYIDYDENSGVIYALLEKGYTTSLTIYCRDWSTDKLIETQTDPDATVTEDGDVTYDYTNPDGYSYSLKGKIVKSNDNYSATVYFYNYSDTRPLDTYYVCNGALIDRGTTQYRADFTSNHITVLDGYTFAGQKIDDDYKTMILEMTKSAATENSTVTVNYIKWLTGEVVGSQTESITVTKNYDVNYSYYIDPSYRQKYDNVTAQTPVYKDGEYTVDVYLWDTDDQKDATVQYTYLYKNLTQKTLSLGFNNATTVINNNVPDGYVVNSVTCKDGVYYANTYKGSTRQESETRNVYNWSTQEKAGVIELTKTITTTEEEESSSLNMANLYKSYTFSGIKFDGDDIYIFNANDTATLPVTFRCSNSGADFTDLETVNMEVKCYYSYTDDQSLVPEEFKEYIPDGYYYSSCTVNATSATVYLTKAKQTKMPLKVQIIDWATDDLIEESTATVTVYSADNYVSYSPTVDLTDVYSNYDGFDQKGVTVDEDGEYVYKIYVYHKTDMKTIQATYVDSTTGAILKRISFDAAAAFYQNALTSTYCPEGYRAYNWTYENGEYIVKVTKGTSTQYKATQYFVNWVTGEELYSPQETIVERIDYEGSSYTHVESSTYISGYRNDTEIYEQEDGSYVIYTYLYQNGDSKNMKYKYVYDGETVKEETVKVVNFYLTKYVDIPEGYRQNGMVELQPGGDEVVINVKPYTGSESAEQSPSYSDIYIASDSYKMAPGASQTLEIVNIGDKEVESVTWSANDSVTITKDSSDPLKATLKVNSSTKDGTFVSIEAKVKADDGNTYTYTTSIMVVASSYKFKLDGLSSKNSATSKKQFEFTPVIIDNATGKAVDLDDINAKFYIVSFDGNITDAKGNKVDVGEKNAVSADQTFTVIYDSSKGTQKLVAGITYEDESGYTKGLHKTYTFVKGVEESEFDPAQTTAVTAKNASDGVELSWNPVTKATGYKLYRKIGTGSWKPLKTVSGTSYTDTGLTSGTTYSYRLKAVDENNTTSKNYTTTVSLVYLSTPVITSIENTASTYMTAKWSAVTGAEGYIVVVLNADTDRVWIDTYVDKDTTSYKIDCTKYGIESGTNVSVIVEAEKEMTLSADATKTVMRLAQPSIYNIYTADGRAIIAWQSVAGATSYTVSRKASGESSWTPLVTQDATSGSMQGYIDEDVTSGTTYIYTVRALCGSVKSSYNKTGTTLAVPANTTISPSITSTGEKISWKAVTGADNYYLTISNANTGDVVFGPKATTDTSYVFTEAQPGVKYTAEVETAVGNNLSSGATRNFVYVDRADIQIITNTDAGIHLEWNKSEGATKYTVYRKVSGESKFTALSKTETGTSYDDTTVEAGTEYIYTVRAYYSSTSALYDKTGTKVTRLAKPAISKVENKTSGIKVTVKAVTGATSYTIYCSDGQEKTVKTNYATFTGLTDGNTYFFTAVANADNGSVSSVSKEKYLRRLSTPVITSIANVSKSIILSWTPVEGTDTYRVYRRVKGTSTWTTLDDVIETTYEDKKAVAGTTYQYSIRAYFGSMSSYYDTTGTAIMRLKTPKITSCASKKTYTGVTFSGVTGAESYTVYSLDDENNIKAKLGTVTATTKTSYTFRDTTAKTSGYYYYVVVANAGGYTSGMSEIYTHERS